MKRNIGFLLFDNVTVLDVSGPLETFHCVNVLGHAAYNLHFIGQERGAIHTESGMTLHADYSFDNAPALDTLIVPGGCGARDPLTQRAICPWLQQVKSTTRRIASVCTGAFLLGQAKLLEGRTATTHWAHVQELQDLVPNCTVKKDAIYCHQPDLSTSAGISAGIDLSLKLIEDDLGAQIASEVARYLVMHFKRSGNQTQYSLPLKNQFKDHSQFASLVGWIMDNIDKRLSVGEMAEQCAMSERNFHRRFTKSFGQSPSRFVEEMRLDFVRQMLTDSQMSVSTIASATGFASHDSLRRAFERHFGVSPQAYRSSFTIV